MMNQQRAANNRNQQASRLALRDVSNRRAAGNGAAKAGGKPVRSRSTSTNATSSSTSDQSTTITHIRFDSDEGFEVSNRSNNTAPIITQDDEAFESYQYSGPADKIDDRDADDPLCVTSYVQDMYQHFRSKEAFTTACPEYMDNQQYIDQRMRSILVDWLVEVHLKFKLVPETLYLVVNLIDRYLAKKEVTRSKLQLVGVTALFIATKYEEIYPPELRDLVYICDRAYSKFEIIEMEETILKTLEYQVTIPSAHAFLVRYLKAGHADKTIVQLSCYILDGTLQCYKLLDYLPSELASAAVLIARKTLGRNPWSPTLLKYAQYREEDIVPVARAILEEKAAVSSELNAVIRKYSRSVYGCVANIDLPSPNDL